MKKDGAHSVEHGLMNLLRNPVGNSVVSAVSPPDYNVGVFQNLVRYAAVFVVERRGRHLDILLFAEKTGNCVVYAVRIHRRRSVVRIFFVNVFVPYENSYHVC